MEAFTKVETFEYDERDRLVTKTTTYTPTVKTEKKYPLPLPDEFYNYFSGSARYKSTHPDGGKHPSLTYPTARDTNPLPRIQSIPTHPPKDVPFTRWEPLTP